MGRERTGTPTRAELVDALEKLAGAVDAHAVRWANTEGVDELVDALEHAQSVVDRAHGCQPIGELLRGEDALDRNAAEAAALMHCGQPLELETPRSGRYLNALSAHPWTCRTCGTKFRLEHTPDAITIVAAQVDEQC